MTAQSTRRDILQGIVGLSVASYVLGYALPIGIGGMFDEADGCLQIGANETYTLATGDSETWPCVSWLGGGAQLELRADSTLVINA